MSEDDDLALLDVKQIDRAHEGKGHASRRRSSRIKGRSAKSQAHPEEREDPLEARQLETKHGRRGMSAREGMTPLKVRARATQTGRQKSRAQKPSVIEGDESEDSFGLPHGDGNTAPSPTEAVGLGLHSLPLNRAGGGAAEKDVAAKHVQVEGESHLQGELWVHKYSPRVKEDLAIHKKKVAEVLEWLHRQLLRSPGVNAGNRVLVLTGPPGAGKTAVVQNLAQELNCEVVEWTTPVPVLWDEHLHFNNRGSRYMSKLDEFEEFLDLSMKFPSLNLVSSPQTSAAIPVEMRGSQKNQDSQATRKSPQAATRKSRGQALGQRLARERLGRSVETPESMSPSPGSSPQEASVKTGKLLLVEDLPLAADRQRRQRLADSLYHLACSARFPAVVVISDVTSEGGTNKIQDRQAAAEYISSLERGGATKISFNPITTLMLTKLLLKVAEAEQRLVAQEAIAAIAAGSSGDVRHALMNLQFHCLGSASTLSLNLGSQKGRTARSKKRKKPGVSEAGAALSQLPNSTAKASAKTPRAEGSRDDVLGLYHALGKILYNKRSPADQPIQGSLDMEVAEELRRPTMQAETPEMIIAQAHLEASTLAAHLHENVLEFLTAEAVEVSSCIAAYMSDSDLLSCQSSGVGWRGRTSGVDASAAADHLETDPSRISVAASASVVARGVMFANSRPAPPRWLAFRGPAMWQMERRRRSEAEAIIAAARLGCCSWMARGMPLLATELHPFAHKIVAALPMPPTSTTAPRLASIEDTGDMEKDEEDSKDMEHQHPETRNAHTLCDLQQTAEEPRRSSTVQDGRDDAIEEW